MLFVKNKLIIYNKILHSLPIVTSINLIIAIIASTYMDVSFINSFFILMLGSTFHIFTDILKNKDLFLFYPFFKKGYSLSLSNYFDPFPIIILMTTIFLFIFINDDLKWFLKTLPFTLLIIYFTIKFILKRIIVKSLSIDNNSTFIIPTFNFHIWQIILLKETSSVIYNLNVLNKKFTSINYFPNEISEDSSEILSSSALYKKFQNEYSFLYKKEYIYKDQKYIIVFDLKNFFSLFKREQIFFEIVIKNNKLKESIRL